MSGVGTRCNVGAGFDDDGINFGARRCERARSHNAAISGVLLVGDARVVLPILTTIEQSILSIIYAMTSNNVRVF